MTSRSPPALGYFSLILPITTIAIAIVIFVVDTLTHFEIAVSPFMALLFSCPSDSSTPGVSLSWLPAALHLRY